jgi:cardiolipin synthase
MIWLLALPLLLASVALSVYVIFGWPGRSSFVAKRESLLAELAPLTRSIEESLASWADPESPEAGTLERLGGFPPMLGNCMKLLPDGEAAFAKMFAAIEQAERYVLIQFYIIRDDHLGHELREHLLHVLRRGVKVYITFDCFESTITSEYLAPLRELGGKAISFKPDKDWRRLLWKGFRNHRKLIVIDGKTAFMGGLNVGDEYVNRDPSKSPWNDTHMCLQGPCVVAAQLSFVQDYYCMGKVVPQVDWTVHKASEAACTVGLLSTGPSPHFESCTLMFLFAMARARRRVWLASPYFIPDEKGMAALHLAAFRGLDVRVLIPGSSDIAPTEFLAWHYIQRLLPLGIRFFRQKEGCMHQKVLLIDDDLALIGSANYDRRSFFLNLEMTAWIEGKSTAGAVEAMLLSDQERCEEITQEHVRRRSLLDKAKTQVTRLFTGIM